MEPNNQPTPPTSESPTSPPAGGPPAPTQPETPPIPSTPSASRFTFLKNKKFLMIGAVALVFLLLAGAGRYLYLQNQIATTPPPAGGPEPSASPDPTAGWKTGTLSSLSFKYPNSWSIFVVNDDQQLEIKLSNSQDKKGPELVLYTIENPKELSLKDFGSDWEIKPNFYSATAEERIVSGITGYYQKDQNCEPLNCDKFAISYNKKLYLASFVYPEIEPDRLTAQVQEYRPFFNQILSTFKFSNSPNTSEIVEIENAAKTAFVNKIGQEPTTQYGLSEPSLKTIDNWAFGILTVAPPQEGAGPGAHFFLARKIDSKWQAVIEYTEMFKQWLQESPDGLVSPEQKASWL